MTPPAAAIAANLVDMKNVNTHKCVRLIIDVPAEQAALVIATFGWPTMVDPVPVAIARLNGAPKPEPPPAAPAARPARTDKRDWSDVPSAEQAGIRCAEPRFWRFLNECHPDAGPVINSTDECRDALYLLLGIGSRKEIAGKPAVFNAWQALNVEFSTWAFMEGRDVR